MREQNRIRFSMTTTIVLLICSMFLFSCGIGPLSSEVYHTEDAENYNKDVILEKYGGDLDSDLSIFPDEIITDEVEYFADFKTNLFDTDGRMILISKYDDVQFYDEIKRIETLSKTIKFEDKQYTNNVLFSEDTYAYPAYITIDGFGNTYEYALIDDADTRIIYIYLSYPDSNTLKQYRDYVKKDLSVYQEENTKDAYSLYNHSFDGGNSWVEFDD